MRLSKKTEYACLGLIELARHYETADAVTIASICEKGDIPKKFLEQILLILRGSGYVESIRGWQGGYKLAKPPEEISLAEIIRLIDGPLAPVNSVSEFFYQNTPVEKNEKLLQCFKEIRDFTARKLEGITFQDLIT